VKLTQNYPVRLLHITETLQTPVMTDYYVTTSKMTKGKKTNRLHGCPQAWARGGGTCQGGHLPLEML